MATRKDEFEAEALQLPAGDRAALVRRLIESLDAAEVGDFEAEWIEEAELRYTEYRKGLAASRPAEQVFREAKARLE